jgi:hypothetical protein
VNRPPGHSTDQTQKHEIRRIEKLLDEALYLEEYIERRQFAGRIERDRSAHEPPFELRAAPIPGGRSFFAVPDLPSPCLDAGGASR